MAKRSKTLVIEGNIYWPKVFEHNREMTDHEGKLITPKFMTECDDEDLCGRYTVDIHIDRETLKAVKDAGCRQSPKKDSEGFPKEFEDGYKLQFTRWHHSQNDKMDFLTGPPVVKFAPGIEPDEYIGNGSKARLTLNIYTGKNSAGKEYTTTTLMRVDVLDLIKFERDDGVEPEEPAAETETSDDIPF